jgi:hypothetical protein
VNHHLYVTKYSFLQKNEQMKMQSRFSIYEITIHLSRMYDSSQKNIS